MKNRSVDAVGILHNKLVFGRRVNVLSDWFARATPKRCRILDVGCGDGLISALLSVKRPDLIIQGIDVLRRDRAHIPVEIFNGQEIPFSDGSFDFLLFSTCCTTPRTQPSCCGKHAGWQVRESLLKITTAKGWLPMRVYASWIGSAMLGLAWPCLTTTGVRSSGM